MDDSGILMRFALYVDFGVLFGLPLFSLYALHPEERSSFLSDHRRKLIALVIIGLVLSLINVIIMAKSMSGADSYTDIEMSVVSMVVTGTDFGMAWQVRIAALLLCLGLTAGATLQWRSLFLLCIGAGIALASLAWAGHAVMDDGLRRYVHLGIDIAHLLAAATWAGALAAFVFLASNPARVNVLSYSANGFAKAGTYIVVVLLVTGAINYGMIVGARLAQGAYGVLLLLKLALFSLMLCLAAANRFRLAPRLEAALLHSNHNDAVQAMRRSLLLEAGLACLVFAVVAALGVQSPGT